MPNFKGRRTSKNVRTGDKDYTKLHKFFDSFNTFLWGENTAQIINTPTDEVAPLPWETKTPVDPNKDPFLDYPRDPEGFSYKWEGPHPSYSYDVWSGTFKHSPTLLKPKVPTNWSGPKYHYDPKTQQSNNTRKKLGGR